jgi:hypothetical protein
MKIAEIVDPAEHLKVQNLDRAAKQAAYNLKRERYQQRLKSYGERIKSIKPGATLPKKPEAPEPPKPPGVN